MAEIRIKHEILDKFDGGYKLQLQHRQKNAIR